MSSQAEADAQRAEPMVVSQAQADEATLRTRDAQYRALFERSRDALVTLAPPTWQFTSGNPAAVALFGARGERDFVSRAPWQYSPELQPDGRSSREKSLEMIETAMSEGSSCFPWTYMRPSGETFPATVLLTRIDVAGQAILQATVRDETQCQRRESELRRAKDEAEAATHAKSEFLANMSHELRTPMNAVVGLAHLLGKTELTARQRSLLDKIASSADSMVSLISNILDFSKIETGKLEIEAVEFEIAHVLDTVAAVLGNKAAEKGLTLRFHQGDGVPRVVIGDPLRLGQVLLNLAGNAVKFTERGEISVSATLSAQAGRAARLRFAVSDTGPGIPLDRQKSIFEPFVQADGSITRRFGGTGLGLAISRQLVEMMAGALSLESTPGSGSIFAFTISVGLPPSPSQKLPPPRLDGDSHLRALVVDDSLTGREVLRSYLAGMSFIAQTVASGRAALDELQASRLPYDVVLLDWCMPQMDGPEVARRISEQSGLAKPPRVLLVTALDPSEVKELPPGVHGVIYKPVTESTLLDAIMTALHADRRPASVASKAPGTSSLLAGRRVLVVEDNRINQEVACGILEDFGMQVAVAGNGRQALATLASDAAFDLVLMDVQMPVMDGYSATQAIRSDPRLAGLPIVALTADALSSERSRCLAGGMDEYVTKPISPGHLRDILERVLTRLRPRIPPSLPAAAAPAPATALASTVTKHPDEPARSPATPAMEALPGLEVGAGLRRLMGNRSLYLRLLRGFAEEHREDVERIRSALDRGDVAAARAVAHKLKGVASQRRPGIGGGGSGRAVGGDSGGCGVGGELGRNRRPASPFGRLNESFAAGAR